MIRKSFDRITVHAQPLGSCIEKKYRLMRDKHGNCIYEEKGEVNVKDYVNSFKNGCSLANLLERVALMPTREKLIALAQTETVYADVSDMPKSFVEAYTRAEELKANNPEIFARMQSGENINDIIKDFTAKALEEQKNAAKEDKVNEQN